MSEPTALERARARRDALQRRRATRAGRDKGCRVYIPAEDLLAAGIDPDGPLPWFRTWGFRRGSVLIRFYREP